MVIMVLTDAEKSELDGLKIRFGCHNCFRVVRSRDAVYETSTTPTEEAYEGQFTSPGVYLGTVAEYERYVALKTKENNMAE